MNFSGQTDIALESAEVESRVNDLSHNSWAKKHGRRKSVKIMGQEYGVSEVLEWRVRWGQRGMCCFAFIALVLYILSGGDQAGLLVATTVSSTIIFVFMGMLYYNNVSLAIMKRLFREMNVWIILILSLCNMIIDVVVPMNSFSPIMAFIYFLVVVGFLFMDATKVKSRAFIIGFGSLFTIFNLYCIYGNTFGTWGKDIVLLSYTILGEEYTIMKRSTKRSIFIQIFLFSMAGMYTLFKDKKMELMVFATGNIYRETGTALQSVADEVSVVGRRKSVTLMGQEFSVNESLEWRVKWGQRGMCCFGLISLACYIVAGGRNVGLLITVTVTSAIIFVFMGILYYKNTSLLIMKRLLQEMNVWSIVMLSLCNTLLDVFLPSTPIFGPIMGIIFFVVTIGFIFMDAISVKARTFSIVYGSIFTLYMIYCIYGNTFGTWGKGIVLFKYTIQGEEYTVMKRSTKRSIFLQIFLFAMTGVYTLFKDRKSEYVIFATGNIYRETGTAIGETAHTRKTKEMRLK
jgi:hypothetical protein